MREHREAERRRGGAGVALRSIAAGVLLGLALLFLQSCLTISQSLELLASRAVSYTLLNQYQNMVRQATKSLSPEEEYYVGRSVAAHIFQTYPPYAEAGLTSYLNLLGQGLSLYSDRPAIFKGYRFIALDSLEVNAFATPGGHVLLTRGLLRLAESEDEVAAVLAHEIAHIALGHGLSSIQGFRLTRIASAFALEAGRSQGGSTASFTGAFGEAISELAQVLIVSGYSQSFELAVDKEATRILFKAGYDPGALKRLVSRLSSSQVSTSYAKTHPEPATRLFALNELPLRAPVAVKKATRLQEEKNSLDLGPAIPLEAIRRERFDAARRSF
ncbi:MAG: peptidase M48 Ste24p [Spirochaetes bacterium]|nr:MAG: peptidase M48 Ste24p [Spirochaetota bacterium]